jgi:hypothetical protein
MTSASRISWWLIIGELLCLGIGSLLGAFFMFSILPVSTAILVGIATLATFPLVRHRLDARAHFRWVAFTWIGLSVFFLCLILWLGRAPFEWLLDWS